MYLNLEVYMAIDLYNAAMFALKQKEAAAQTFVVEEAKHIKEEIEELAEKVETIVTTEETKIKTELVDAVNDVVNDTEEIIIDVKEVSMQTSLHYINPVSYTHLTLPTILRV